MVGTTERARQAARLRAALSQLRCGQVAKSYKKDKKIMQKVCDGDGKQKIIHAGQAGAPNNPKDDPKKKRRSARDTGATARTHPNPEYRVTWRARCCGRRENITDGTVNSIIMKYIF